MLIHWIWLSALPHVTAKQKLKLLQLFQDPEDIYQAAEESFAVVEGMTDQALDAMNRKDLTPSRQILAACSEKNISILTYGDSNYPSKLKNIEQPPLVLYYRGCLPNWDDMPVVAMVGTRRATAYGLQAAETLGYQIACCGALVVSGGADGIDTYALQGALQTGRKVCAVFGCGVDVVYPKKNGKLFEKIAQQGCLISEYPPGTPANSWNFPQRNRILSGMADGVTVVEAPQRSGALNTAKHASDQGRDVFVVPGNVNSENSAGSNQLLRGRAIPVFTGWDVVREYAAIYPHGVKQFTGSPTPRSQVAQEPIRPQTIPPVTEGRKKKPIDNCEKSQYSVEVESKIEALSQEERLVYDCLTDIARPVDEIIASLELPSGKVLAVLTMLAMKGLCRNHPGKLVSK